MISQEQFEQLRPGDWIQFEMERVLLEVADLQVAGRQIICWAPRHFIYGLYVGLFDAYQKLISTRTDLVKFNFQALDFTKALQHRLVWLESSECGVDLLLESNVKIKI